MEVCRLADVVNMLVERQRTVSDHTQTLNTGGCLDVDSSSLDCVDVVFYPLSFNCAKYNCLSFLRIQAQSIEVEPVMKCFDALRQC